MRILTMIVVLLLLVSIAGINLPQVRVQVTIEGKKHKLLKDYFGSMHEIPNELDSKIEKALLGALPQTYRKGCKEMVSYWGTSPARTASNLVRIIYLREKDAGVRDIILAYACYSKQKEFGSKYYDERLALLSIGTTSSSLTMIPHDRDCDNCSDLSHIGLPDSIQLSGTPGVSIPISLSNDNPCCGGPSLSNEERTYFFLFADRDLTKLLSVVRRRETVDHDDEEGDLTTLYDADISFEKDGNGSIVRILSNYSVTENGRATKRGLAEYVWNKKSKQFNERLH